ncbi:MAG: tetratricopeptide repeat protein [Planctomycetota bacterium]|jgi:Tfp pilus assembly protein PilF
MKPLTKIITVVLLTSLLLSSGCGRLGLRNRAEKPKDIELTPIDIEQTRLLKQIERDFEDPEAHYKLGTIYQQKGRWAEADTEFKTALNFDPVHRKAQAARIKTLLSFGDQAKADMLTDIYIEQTSNSAAASLKLGLAFQKQTLDELALKCYNQALTLAPNSARVNKQVGYYYLSKGEKDRGKDYLLRSFRLDQNQPEVAGELGRLGIQIERQKREANTKKLDKIVDEETKTGNP